MDSALLLVLIQIPGIMSALQRTERLVPVAQDHSAIRRLYLAASRAMRTLTFSAVELPAPALSPLPIQWHH